MKSSNHRAFNNMIFSRVCIIGSIAIMLRDSTTYRILVGTAHRAVIYTVILLFSFISSKTPGRPEEMPDKKGTTDQDTYSYSYSYNQNPHLSFSKAFYFVFTGQLGDIASSCFLGFLLMRSTTYASINLDGRVYLPDEPPTSKIADRACTMLLARVFPPHQEKDLIDLPARIKNRKEIRAL
jgi:hypothetical protein